MIRKITFLFVLFFTLNTVKSQTVVKELKTVQVLTPQTFYLNGGNRATFGGKSRVYYNFQLPPNTVEWYYSFTTSKGEDPTKSIQLMSQLTRLVDPTGYTAIATNAILTPSGAAVCDIYMMDKLDADKFLEKVDNWGGTFRHYPVCYRENFKNGTVQVKDIRSGNYCLGFKNPSAVQGINISFEIVAIVEETKIREKTQSETKAEMFAELGWKAYEKGDYDKCMELSKKALELNPELGWINNNIGLVHLIKKDYVSAIDSYGNAIAFFKKDKSNSKRWFKEAVSDLNQLILKHGEIEGAKDILDLLQQSMK